jgi:hypothetical protein
VSGPVGYAALPSGKHLVVCQRYFDQLNRPQSA